MLLELDRPRFHADPAFRDDVLAGLAARPRAIPARWFYDAAGSALFEEITGLPEYYPTRTETALLRHHGADIAALVGKGRAVIEFGSGSSTKTPLLLNAIDPAAYRIGAEAVWLADQRDRAAAIDVPTLIMVGEEDRITPPALSQELARLIAGSQLICIPQAGHLANAEQPQAFNSAIESFLAQRG